MNFKRCLICGKKMTENMEKCSSGACPFKIRSGCSEQQQKATSAKSVDESLKLKNGR